MKGCMRRVLIAIVFFILVGLAIVWVATLTSDDVQNADATRAQNAIEATWDAELTAEANE